MSDKWGEKNRRKRDIAFDTLKSTLLLRNPLRNDYRRKEKNSFLFFYILFTADQMNETRAPLNCLDDPIFLQLIYTHLCRRTYRYVHTDRGVCTYIYIHSQTYASIYIHIINWSILRGKVPQTFTKTGFALDI